MLTVELNHCLALSQTRRHHLTLPVTNMGTQKGPYKDYSPSERGLYMGFHVSLGECNPLKHQFVARTHEKFCKALGDA